MLKKCFVFGLATMSLALHAEIQISEPWVRLLPPNVTTTAGYLSIQSDQDDQLISAQSEAVEAVEIHEMKMDKGVMQMAPVDKVSLPAGASVALSPGGLHLMLIGLKQPLKEGQEIPVTLTFESGASETFDFMVKAP